MPLVHACLAGVFLIVVSSNIASVMSSSLTVQKSSFVVIGDRVEMKCNVTGSDLTTWMYTAWNSSTETNIYLGTDIVVAMRSRYTIDKRISGQHNLIIDSVDWVHAGRYRCTAAIQKTLWKDTLLTILGSHPVCAANTSEAHVDGNKQTHLTIWCSISYTGNGFPVFNWTKSNAEKIIAVKTTTSDRGLVTNTSLIIQQLHANDNGVTFQCQITFLMPNNFKENVYEYTWNYTLYGPMNLSIGRNEDRLVCSAEGNPAPTYRWKHVETNTSSEGSVFILKVTSGKDHTFQCTASNLFAVENINITIKGPTKDSDGTKGVPITALAIGGSLLLLLIVAIIVSCNVHRKRLKEDTSDRPDVALNTDLSSYDEIALSSDRSPNYILGEDRLSERSDGRMIVDNVVYSEVCKPKGRSNGGSGSNLGENSRPLQTPTRERKNIIGADGTEYAELSRVKPPARKGEVPKPPAFSRVEVYASIDHNGRAPPPPPKL